MFLFWLRTQTRHAMRKAQRTSKPAGRHATFRPRLEALEDRCVPSTLTVTNNLDSGPGSLRAEIAAAQAGDTITFSNSTANGAVNFYDGTLHTITLTSGELLVNNSLTVQGAGAGQLAISGGNNSRVFEVAAGVQATLTGLTIRDGNGWPAARVADGAGDGGAILNWGTLTLNNSTVSGSSAGGSTGGGIYSAGMLTLGKDTISGNTAYRAGGIYSSGTATLTGCTLTNNTATGGWPTYFLWDTSMAWSYGAGGGIYNDGTMTVTSCTLSGNTVANGGAGGGGIYNSRKLTVKNSTVSGNSALEYGGGIYNDSGAVLTLQSKEVTKNTAFVGADIYLQR